MNNNVSATNGLDRQSAGLSQSGPGGEKRIPQLGNNAMFNLYPSLLSGDAQPPKSRYVPPHLRGSRGGGGGGDREVAPRFSEERNLGGGGGRGGQRGGRGEWDESRGAYRRDDRANRGQ